MRYNRNLIPHPHYHKFGLNDVRHLIMLRDGHPNKYPKLEDFRKFRKTNIQSGRLRSGDPRNSNNIILEFIRDNHSAFDQIFQSAQFLKGLSVNLFSVYRKRDSFVKVAKSEIDKDVHKDWNEGDKGIIPHNLISIPDNQSTGIKCKDLPKIKVEHHYEPTKNSIPGCKFIIGLHFAHKPSYCNFWHCEITMYIEVPSGNKYIGFKEIREFLINKYQENDTKADKKVKDMAKIIRQELYRYLVLNPKGRKKYLPKRRYMVDKQ